MVMVVDYSTIVGACGGCGVIFICYGYTGINGLNKMTNTIEMTVEDIWEMEEVAMIHIKTHRRIEYGTKIVKHDNGKLYSVLYTGEYGEGYALGDGANIWNQNSGDLVALTEVEEREVVATTYVEV